MQRSSSFSLNGCVEIQIFLSASFNHEQRLVKQKYWMQMLLLSTHFSKVHEVKDWETV